MAIISTNVATIPEIIRNGETGLTVSAGDAAALTQALWDLATNPSFRSFSVNMPWLTPRARFA